MGNVYLEDVGNRYSDEVLDQVARLCVASDLIGITLMTNFFESGVRITRRLKEKLKTPIIWGGIHPTIRPEESLQYADIVCFGEGDEAVVELAQKMEEGKDYYQVKNFWFNKNGQGIIRNEVRPLSQNLDSIPAPDYGLDDSYLLHDNVLCKLDKKLLGKALRAVSLFPDKIGYQTMSSRGCPHNCTYCCNSSLRNLYKGQRYVRWRSREHVIEELLRIKKEMEFVDFIWFSDDSFFARKTEEIEKFSLLYKEKIGLPFFCLGSPMTINEEKMEALIDAGLYCIQMGLETGSSRIQAIFNRKYMPNEKMLKAAKIINKYNHKMLPPHYDLIIDVPYETDEDKLDTLKLILDLPKPYNLQPFSLVIYPETELYIMAEKDGLIKDEKIQIYNKMYSTREENYLNLLIVMCKNGKFPHPLLRVLISKPALLLLNNRFMKTINKWLFIFAKNVYRALQNLTPKRKVALREG